jgi:hypothetical protein
MTVEPIRTQPTPEEPKPAFSVPPAFHQTSQPLDRLLHSGNSGVIIQRTGQLRGKYRSEGREFARELATYINEKQPGVATVFVYEETFGTKERIHWWIHLRSLDDYPTMVAMGAKDEEFRDLILRPRTPEGDRWDVMFLDGSLQETVLVPQRWTEDGPGVALDQVSGGADGRLNSATAGSVLQLSGTFVHPQGRTGRQALRSLAERFNDEHGTEACALLYEEGFGQGERVHCVLHLPSLGHYPRLAGSFLPGVVPAPEASVAEEPWRASFVDGSLREVGLTPQFWGLYATRQPAG